MLSRKEECVAEANEGGDKGKGRERGKGREKGKGRGEGEGGGGDEGEGGEQGLCRFDHQVLSPCLPRSLPN